MYNKLIFQLKALYGNLKIFHYKAKGHDFYGNHLFADRLIDTADVMNAIDDIQEICYLGRGEEALSWKVIDLEASKIITEAKDCMAIITDTLELLEETLESIEEYNDMTIGEANLIGGIAQNLQQTYGLLNRETL